MSKKHKSNFKAYRIVILLFVSSIVINSIIDLEYANSVVVGFVFNYMSALVALIVAVNGLVFPYIRKIMKMFSDDDNIQSSFDRVNMNLIDNTKLVLFSYFGTIICVFLKGVKGTLLPEKLIGVDSWNFGMNVAIVSLIMLTSVGVYDSAISTLKLLQLDS